MRRIKRRQDLALCLGVSLITAWVLTLLPSPQMYIPAALCLGSGLGLFVILFTR